MLKVGEVDSEASALMEPRKTWYSTGTRLPALPLPRQADERINQEKLVPTSHTQAKTIERDRASEKESACSMQGRGYGH